MYSLVLDLMIYELKEYDVIHDTEIPLLRPHDTKQHQTEPLKVYGFHFAFVTLHCATNGHVSEILT